jgi:ArsR family transcriptional regulator
MSNLPTIEQEKLAEQFQALGNRHRLAIFEFLARNCCVGTTASEDRMVATVGKLASMLTIAPSTVSHHLKELRTAGLIAMDRNGQERECWVEPEVIQALGRYFGDLLPAGCAP